MSSLDISRHVMLVHVMSCHVYSPVSRHVASDLYVSRRVMYDQTRQTATSTASATADHVHVHQVLRLPPRSTEAEEGGRRKSKSPTDVGKKQNEV